MSLTPGSTNAKGQGSQRRGATRHCCYGLCNSDSRYSDRDYMQGVSWLPFPKPHKDLDKCRRWVKACSREGFTMEKVNKWTYICTKHFLGGNGPTEESPDPIPASYTSLQLSNFTRACSAHFKPSDFTRCLEGLRRLKANAVPSIFAWSTTKPKRIGPQRKSLKKKSQEVKCVPSLTSLVDTCTSHDHDYDAQPLRDAEKLEAAHVEIARLNQKMKEMQELCAKAEMAMQRRGAPTQYANDKERETLKLMWLHENRYCIDIGSNNKEKWESMKQHANTTSNADFARILLDMYEHSHSFTQEDTHLSFPSPVLTIAGINSQKGTNYTDDDEETLSGDDTEGFTKEENNEYYDHILNMQTEQSVNDSSVSEFIKTEPLEQTTSLASGSLETISVKIENVISND